MVALFENPPEVVELLIQDVEEFVENCWTMAVQGARVH